MNLEKYSFGIGDRFGKEGRAQLRAIQEINKLGVPVVPVWNKSNREHQLVGSTQSDVAREAEDAVRANGWASSYYVDADHINLSNVETFLSHSSFFTLDVADFIGRSAPDQLTRDFVQRNIQGVFPDQVLPGMALNTKEKEAFLNNFADQYLTAIQEVKNIYDYILVRRSGEPFVPEVSMDEVAIPQSPLDIYFILKELKHLGVEPQTIAPRFSGLFAKGVDYEGDIELFSQEFEMDVRILQHAIQTLDLPSNLKLSVHSGSDKFSIYPVIREILHKYDAGIHVKTAGTTWLEEVIGLARGGMAGLAIAKFIYREAMGRYDELAGPYSTVLHISRNQLPPVKEVLGWKADRFTKTLTHDQRIREYNPNFRQLMHIAYKIAAEMGPEFLDALDYYRDSVEEQVYTNLLDRHLKRLFQ